MKKVLFLFAILSMVFTSSMMISNNAVAQPVLYPCNNCTDVTNLIVTNITNTTADLSWQHPGAHCGFMIYIYNQTDGTSTSYSIPSGNTHTITGLNPLSSYRIFVAQIYTPSGPDDLPVDCAGVEATFATSGDGIGCDCDMVYNIQATNITNTTADISWSCNASCQDFYVMVTDMNNNQSQTYMVLGATNYTVTGLSPGGFYSIDIAVISNAVPGICCASDGIFITADHAGIPCWDCEQPSNVNVTSVTKNSAVVSWTPGGPCNDFEIYVWSPNGGGFAMYTTTGTSYTLTGLNPSTTYTVTVAMKNVQVPGISCAGESADFTTLHCGDFTQSLTHYVQTLIFGNPGGGIVYNQQQPYLSSTSSFNFSQGSYYQFAFDHINTAGSPAGTIYANVWFDFNNDGIFSPSERVSHYQFSYSGGASFLSRAANNTSTSSCGPCGFTAPNQAYYNIKGRCIISYNNSGPCGPVSNGQVLDFSVNIQ